MSCADSSEHFATGVVILAAGASSRMGQAKLLLPWRDMTVLGHLLATWRGLGTRQIAVVHAPNTSALHAELDHLGHPPGDRILNPAPERGMFSSIECAARWPGWQPSLTHWAFVLGDQPHLRPETLAGLLTFAAAQPGKICQPARHGRGRHPVILPRSAFHRLGNETEILSPQVTPEGPRTRPAGTLSPRGEEGRGERAGFKGRHGVRGVRSHEDSTEEISSLDRSRQLPSQTAGPTLQDFLASSPEARVRWESSDAGLDLDLDTPADYARALAEFGGGKLT